MTSNRSIPEGLEAWAASAASELGVAEPAIPVAQVLKLAADVAHSVARPAAPLSTFLLGVAVGRGANAQDLTRAITQLTEHAKAWGDVTATGNEGRE